MRTRQRRGTRRGFTLMEVLLASAIAGLVLYAVYTAIDTQMRFAADGRAIVEEATLARSLMARISADVQPCVGLADPSRYKQQQNSSSSNPTGQTGQTGQGQPASNTTQQQPMSSSSQPSSNGGSADPIMSTISPDVIRAFVGSETSLRVFISKVPHALQSPATMTTTTTGPDGQVPSDQLESDQHVIAYWFIEGAGLARHDMTVTEVQANGLPGTFEGEDKKYIIAPEVKSLTFSYFDGTNWNPSWDGTALGQDNMTPIGPPVAVAVEIEMQMPATDGQQAKTRKLRHVIAIPAAGGTPQTSSDDSLTPTGQ